MLTNPLFKFTSTFSTIFNFDIFFSIPWSQKLQTIPLTFTSITTGSSRNKFKNNNNVRILSRITIEEKVVLKNLLFSDINFDDEDDISDLIDKLKIIYEDHWKIFNRINTSIKLPIFVKLDTDDNLRVSNFEKILIKYNKL